ncbi:MAG: hypothetical protein WBL05_04165 [Brooklawnia sp.]|uniref:hypothetical protein n=1 Tax=Brooklawnia sp. TaxID=2699740 RepID=UPI003C781CCD
MATARQLLVSAVAAITFLGLASPAVAAPGDVITVTDGELTDSGGLAADPDTGVYWVAGPGGTDVARVSAINPDGSWAGEVFFDAPVGNFESLAYFEGQLYVGDIGDPNRNREWITVYRLDYLEYGASVPYSEWTLYYPDGPHDASTLMISPRGNIWIVTKDDPGGFYYATAPEESGEFELIREAEAPSWVTDGTFINPSTAALRTYTSLLSVDMLLYSPTAQEATPEQGQGESVSLTLSGEGLLLGSRTDPELIEVAFPTSWQELDPAPSAPPGQTAEPTPSETADPGSDGAMGTSPSFGGTVVALGIAGLISLGAAMLVYWRSRPWRRPTRSRRAAG